MHLARYYPILGTLLAVLVDPATKAQGTYIHLDLTMHYGSTTILIWISTDFTVFNSALTNYIRYLWTVCSSECATLVPLIAGNQYKVTDDQLTASSFLNTTHLPCDARLPSGSAWCARDPEPWLQVDFGADIVIHTLSISGSSFSHVTSFQIQSTAASSGELLTTQESEILHVSQLGSMTDS